MEGVKQKVVVQALTEWPEEFFGQIVAKVEPRMWPMAQSILHALKLEEE